MISGRVDKLSFFQGIGAGIGLAGVALLVVGAVRRRQRETASEGTIDGVRPPESVELAARPQEEANTLHVLLESEGPDPVVVSERW
jgi:hypothetical protein